MFLSRGNMFKGRLIVVFRRRKPENKILVNTGCWVLGGRIRREVKENLGMEKKKDPRLLDLQKNQFCVRICDRSRIQTLSFMLVIYL